MAALQGRALAGDAAAALTNNPRHDCPDRKLAFAVFLTCMSLSVWIAAVSA